MTVRSRSSSRASAARSSPAEQRNARSSAEPDSLPPTAMAARPAARAGPGSAGGCGLRWPRSASATAAGVGPPGTGAEPGTPSRTPPGSRLRPRSRSHHRERCAAPALVPADQHAERAGVTASSPRHEDVVIQGALVLVRRAGHLEPRVSDLVVPTPPAGPGFPVAILDCRDAGAPRDRDDRGAGPGGAGNRGCGTGWTGWSRPSGAPSWSWATGRTCSACARWVPHGRRVHPATAGRAVQDGLGDHPDP